MSRFAIFCTLVVALCQFSVEAAPQSFRQVPATASASILPLATTPPPANYEYKYDVADQKTKNYQGHTVKAVNGVIQGTYYTLLPDGRLMKVEYTADKVNGFVSKTSYIENYQPTWPVVTPAPVRMM